MKNLSKEQLFLLKEDSKENQGFLDTVMHLLEEDHITQINVLSILEDSAVSYCGTMGSDDIKYHCLPEKLLWNIINNIDFHRFFQVVPGGNGTTSIYIDNYLNTQKNMFIFNMDAQYFASLSELGRLCLYKRLNGIIAYLSNVLVMQNKFYFIGDGLMVRLPEPLTYYANYKKILNHYTISEPGFNVLNYIALGCTSKVIARHLKLSFRTIEAHIKTLINKFQVQSKRELEYISQIIISQLQHTKELSYS